MVRSVDACLLVFLGVGSGGSSAVAGGGSAIGGRGGSDGDLLLVIDKAEASDCTVADRVAWTVTVTVAVAVAVVGCMLWSVGFLAWQVEMGPGSSSSSSSWRAKQEVGRHGRPTCARVPREAGWGRVKSKTHSSLSMVVIVVGLDRSREVVQGVGMRINNGAC